MLNDLQELLSIESVLSSPSDNAPFGKNMRATLDWFLKKAASYNLKCGELDGYCGYAEVGGGDGMIGVLGHLDVVPAGDGWSYPAYNLTIDEGYLYGRGVVDNKGCVIIALHILKELKEKNIKLKNRIRLIVGCNEENGSLCMKHYKNHGEIPKMSIVPDSDFPIINSEKGILHLELSIPADEIFAENIISLSAGNRANVVPDSAQMTLSLNGEFAEKLKKTGGENLDSSVFSKPELLKNIIASGAGVSDFSLNVSDGKIFIKTTGIAGHAMAPHKADNAIFKLFTLLTALNGSGACETVSLIDKLFCSSLAAERLGIACNDKKSGALTMNLGVINYDKNMINLTLDLRLPISADKDEIVAKIKAKLPKNSNLTILRYAENLYIDESDKLIQTLLNVYTSVTGKPSYTVQTGGGTYARELPNAVAFGPTFPDTVTNIHNIDERISIEQFEKLYEIYYAAILALDKI